MTRDYRNDSIEQREEIKPELIQELRDRLTEATVKCSERCLYSSAKWAAELLNALPPLDDPDSDHDSHMFNADAPTSSYRTFSTSYDDPEEARLEAREAPQYLLAKSYFDTREYDRCASVFLPPAIPAGGLAIYEKGRSRTPLVTPSKYAKARADKNPVSPFPRLSQKSLFLALYARYLAGEKRKEEESEMVLGPADGGQTANRELPALARGLEAHFLVQQLKDPTSKHSQGWLEYLYAVILARTKQEAAAQEWLIRSVGINPYHWGAWEELTALLASVDDLHKHIDSRTLPQNIMTLIYRTHASADLFSTSDAEATFECLHFLVSVFPSSTFLHTQLALCHYHNKDYDTSASIFQDIITTHPYRLDALDHYSNILYVMGDRPKLAFLAHLATSVDKFRPETCCVVGNYYSLCSQHEKAVMYFRRALTLDRSFLSAWTLMGHEYIELKNTHAAIESYRRAVDVNRKDYRAWYGLGQAYEVLDMGFYALYYYQRAAGLRPYDAKMWQAVGSCYAKMERVEQAIKALRRALVAGTYFETETPAPSFSTSTTSVQQKPKPKTTGRKLLDPETLFQIAQLHERMGRESDAASYMELCVKQEVGGSGDVVHKVEKERKKRWRKEKRQQNKRQEAEQRRREQLAAAGAAGTVAAAEEEIDFADGDTEILSSSDGGGSSRSLSDAIAEDEVAEDGFGTGTTPTTSKARLWLARWAWRRGELDMAEKLAEELCMDGFEVEEAKGLVREVRGKREAMITPGDGPVGRAGGGMGQ